MKGTYFRWTFVPGTVRTLMADILGIETEITVDPAAGTVTARVPTGDMDPDTARMIGVRLIEAAALADDGRSIREP